jgi:uncharacterized protein YjbI with pentapeptide repeats
VYGGLVAPPPRFSRTTKRIILASSVGFVLLAGWIAVDQLFMSPRTIDACRIEPGANCTFRNVSGVDLTGVDMSGAIFYKAGLVGTILVDADLNQVNMYQARLDGADLSGAVLVDGELYGAVMTRVTAIGTDFSGSNMSYVDLSGADLTGANLLGVVDEGLKLDGATFLDTTMPDGTIRSD